MKSDGDHLTRWIRLVSSNSPLERLELKLDGLRRADLGPAISFDGLFHHLAAKHGDTLRELCVLHVFVGVEALAATCAHLRSLEVLAVATHSSIAVRFATNISAFWDVLIHQLPATTPGRVWLMPVVTYPLCTNATTATKRGIMRHRDSCHPHAKHTKA